MTYYNRNYEKITLKKSSLKFLDCGTCGKILHNKNTIFKEYFPTTSPRFRLKPEEFDILKNIDNPHFIKLFDIYTNLSLLKLLKNKRKKSPFKIDAYTAKYYPDDSVDALYEQKDYILDNFKELEILFDIFTNNAILLPM